MNIAIVGAQWGDEGKGKIVDLLAPRFSIVARSQGGHNAGHTVYVGGRKFVLRLIPSGILHPALTCIIGNGVVVDLQALFDEVEELRLAGISVDGRLFVSDRAHLVLPYHRDRDKLSEAARGTGRIGTTSRGIGPAYEDKIGRRGIRICDLAEPERLTELVRARVAECNALSGSASIEWSDVFTRLQTLGARVAPWVIDVSVELAEAMRAGKSIMFEGAQGTMLDIDHGTYPYVTSSNATAGGISTGLGIGPRAVHAVVGIAKAYITRVGEGPFPTELPGEEGDRLRERGQEYGSVTGRPRRCGWFDAVVVRHAVRVNGLDGLALTKLDVLDGFAQVPLCTGYADGKRVMTEFPANLARLQGCTPVLEWMPGWSRPTAGARRVEDLPDEARRYVDRIERLTGVPVVLVSSGTAREDTIVFNRTLAEAWFGKGPLGPGGSSGLAAGARLNT